MNAGQQTASRMGHAQILVSTNTTVYYTYIHTYIHTHYSGVHINYGHHYESIIYICKHSSGLHGNYINECTMTARVA